MKLSVIIINFNGLKYLENCLNSIFLNLTNITFEIILFDNNSTDESCNFIKNNYPHIHLIPSNVNYGFGKGNNAAVKCAKGEFLLLLNNDTILLDKLLPVLNILENDRTIGVMGINMLDSNKNYLQVVGKFPKFKNMFRLKDLLNNGVEFKSGSFSKEMYDIDWIGGSFLLLSKNNFEMINGFDEDYFMYVEDVDFCKKIANLGYRRVFMPNFSYIHFVGFNDSKTPLLLNGYKKYLSKHKKGLSYFLSLFALTMNKYVKKLKSYQNSIIFIKFKI